MLADTETITPQEATDLGTALEELLAEDAPEPGDLKRGGKVSGLSGGGAGEPEEADEDLPPLRVATVQSAGYVYLYHTQDGSRSKINKNMLGYQRKKLRDDGKPFFSSRPIPGLRPREGHEKCLLHADNPRRAEFDGFGLPVCRKHNLLNPFQVQQHMKKRHPAEWAAIELVDQKRREERQEALQLKILESAARGAAIPIEVVAAATAEPEARPKPRKG